MADGDASDTHDDSPGSRRPGWIKWVAGGVVAVIVLGVVGPFVYINFIQDDPPEKLTLPADEPSSGSDGSTSTVSEPATLDGEWEVRNGSTAGYRVDETLVGQATTAVGRTSDVTGTFTLAGSTVPSATFTVNMASVTSDQSRHDGTFQRVLDVQNHPDATFLLTQPIDLGEVPAEGVTTEVTATGDLTIKGTTQSVEIPLEVRRTGGTIDVLGTVEITFADYGIDNPSFGPAQVGDVGMLEFLLRFAKPGETTTDTTPSTTRPPQAGDGPVTVPSSTEPPLGL